MTDDPDVTEKLERTDTGYRLSVESTRGTGTRDQDKVKAELRMEDRPSPGTVQNVCDDVRQAMDDRREHHPDEDGDSDE